MPPTLCFLFHISNLGLEFAQLFLQPYFFPVFCCAAAEVGTFGSCTVVCRAVTNAQTREVCVTKLCFAARCCIVVGGRGSPARCAGALNVVIYVGFFKRGAKGGRDATGNAVSFASLVENVQES
jgi:hypothetical protein